MHALADLLPLLPGHWLDAAAGLAVAATAIPAAGLTGIVAPHMDMPALLALAAALGWASGLRLYAVVFFVGLAGAAGWVDLPAGLQLLQHPAVLAASGFLLAVEFLADKIPWLDSLWDAVSAFIRIPGGALLAASVFGADSATMGLVSGLLGGSLAATALATKATARAAVNTSPEPVSNWLLSFAEDGLSLGVVWLALQHPLLFALVLLLILLGSVLLLRMLYRFLRLVLGRARGWFGGSSGAGARQATDS